MTARCFALLFAGLTAVGLAGLVCPAHAQDVSAPVELQGEILAKVLTFDRSFDARLQNGLVVGIVMQRGNRAARAARDGFVAGFTSAAAAIGAAGFRVVEIEYSSAEELSRLLHAHRVDVLYVPPLRSADPNVITRASRERGVLTLSADPAWVRGGLSVGVRLRGDRPVVLVNATAAGLEGSSFSSQLLRLAEVLP